MSSLALADRRSFLQGSKILGYDPAMPIFAEIMKIMRANKARREFPNPFDPRCQAETLFPDFRPRFKLNFDETLSVFTMGPCFSRHLENALAPLGVVLPALAYAPPDESVRYRNEILNDLNPGAISQRVLGALAGKRHGPATLIPVGQLVSDLLLPGEGLVTKARAEARRNEIFDVYAKLPGADVLVITLAGIEAWFDRTNGVFLNRFPPLDFARQRPGRFECLTQDVEDVMSLLGEPIKALGDAGKRVILVVSPAPVGQTYGEADAICANEFGKSVLLVCAARLARKFEHVDYFPAYEIVRWAGLAGLDDNKVHMGAGMAERLTKFFIASYAAA